MDALGTVQAAAVQGLIPFGPGAGPQNQLADGEVPPPRSNEKLCADGIGRVSVGGLVVHKSP